MQLTNSEMEIMEILWATDKPMCRAEILSAPHNFKDSSIHIMLNGLLRKHAIRETGMVKRVKAYSRTFTPEISQERYWAQLIYHNSGKGPRLCGEPDLFTLLIEIVEASGSENTEIKKSLKAIYDGID